MCETEGWTPLMTACLSDEDDVDRVRELIDAGADVNATTTDDGFTALHATAMADWREDEDGRMRVLLEADANKEARANTQAGNEWTPLLLAAAEGYACQVKTLIEWGADVDVEDELGRTPLMLASAQSLEAQPKILTLLDHGADLQKRCHEGLTALDHAEEYVSSLKEAIAEMETSKPDEAVLTEEDNQRSEEEDLIEMAQYLSGKADHSRILILQLQKTVDSFDDVIELLRRDD